MSLARGPLVAPSILSADFARLGEEVRAVEGAGADWIHIDVMDGHFVPNLTLGPAVTAAVESTTDLPLDVHLMIQEPERFLEAFAEAGADVLTVHQEVCAHLHRTLQRIRELGLRAGVALNPATPVELVEDVVPFIDLLLVMTVNPGFGGQSFIEGSLGRIRRARLLLDRHASEARLEVDGGLGPTNAAAVVEAGADVVVAGSAVYGHPGGAAEGVRALRSALEAAGTRRV